MIKWNKDWAFKDETGRQFRLHAAPRWNAEHITNMLKGNSYSEIKRQCGHWKENNSGFEFQFLGSLNNETILRLYDTDDESSGLDDMNELVISVLRNGNPYLKKVDVQPEEAWDTGAEEEVWMV